MSYTQANPDAHAQCLLWKLAKSGHGQLVTLHIGSQRVGRTDTRCVHVHTLLSVCLYQAWLFKTTPKRPERVNPISHPAVFWISDSLSARNQNNPYDWVSCLHEHWHTHVHIHTVDAARPSVSHSDILSDTMGRLNVCYMLRIYRVPVWIGLIDVQARPSVNSLITNWSVRREIYFFNAVKIKSCLQRSQTPFSPFTKHHNAKRLLTKEQSCSHYYQLRNVLLIVFFCIFCEKCPVSALVAPTCMEGCIMCVTTSYWSSPTSCVKKQN